MTQLDTYDNNFRKSCACYIQAKLKISKVKNKTKTITFKKKSIC